jgi:hypothetical protein
VNRLGASVGRLLPPAISGRIAGAINRRR